MTQDGPVSDKKFVPAVLLCFFLGAFGVHRFYLGKIGTRLLMLGTLRGPVIWRALHSLRLIIGCLASQWAPLPAPPTCRAFS